jgi:four helix bundle protein
MSDFGFRVFLRDPELLTLTGGRFGWSGFRDLRVWKDGMDLVEQVYRLTRDFPKQELYGLTNQLRRAAVSVPSNIAEGQARTHVKEYLQFLSTAKGSLAEVQTQLEIAARLEYLTPKQLEQVLQQADALSRQLYALRNALVDRG